LEEINPLQTTFIERGIVSSRVALLLRSAEIKPIVRQICSKEQHLLPPILHSSSSLTGHDSQTPGGF